MRMIKAITETKYKIEIKNEIMTQCNNKWDQQSSSKSIATLGQFISKVRTTITTAEY